MVDWFDRRYGENPDFDELGEDRPKPTIDEVLQAVVEGLKERLAPPVGLSETRLDRLERRLWEDISYFRRLEVFSPSMNYLILSEMFSLVNGGRKVPEEHLRQYKGGLKIHNRDPERGFRL